VGEYDNMLACVRCGLCLTSCPTYVLTLHEAEGPRGRIAMARALAEGYLTVTPDLVEHELNCLVCEACTAICPAGVHMEPIQVALRATLAQERATPWWRRPVRALGYRAMLADMRRLRRGVRLLWLAQRLGLVWLARRLGLLRLLGLKQAAALLPPLPSRFLVPRGETYPALNEGTPPQRVLFFAGCVMSTMLAEIDRATIRVLQRAGCTVVNPAGQGCCGALHAHDGDLETAKALARRTIAAFAGEEPVIVNSAGCGAMLKGYAHLLHDDPVWAERAAAFAARVRDFTEFLAERPPPLRREVRTVATYQDPCHLLHAQRVSRQPRELLRAVPGLELKELGDGGLCCGSAGVYNLTHPEQARRLGEQKVAQALATGARVLVTANPGCLLHLRALLAEQGQAMRVRHIAEVLDEATAEEGHA
jgi:glycolate oxidase iron-sulfur subunit